MRKAVEGQEECYLYPTTAALYIYSLPIPINYHPRPPWRVAQPRLARRPIFPEARSLARSTFRGLAELWSERLPQFQFHDRALFRSRS